MNCFILILIILDIIFIIIPLLYIIFISKSFENFNLDNEELLDSKFF